MLLLKALLLLTVLIPMITSTTDVETRKKRSVSSYAVEGCYSSFPSASFRRRMRGHNSNVKCQEICRDKGFILAATKGDQCQCGNVYPKGKKLTDNRCTSRCRWWSFCYGPQSCCGGPSAYSVSVVGNIDVAKQILRRLSHKWQTNTGYRNYMKSLVRRPTTGSHVEIWISFNSRGWSLCRRGRYMAGLYRHSRRRSDYIYLIEKAYCVDAPGYLYSAKRDQYCYNHNWWKSFNKKGWSTCRNGFYMTGLWRNSGNKLYHIEEAKCCRPKSQKRRWGRCYNHNAWNSFNNKGWTKCRRGYYMVGLYRNSCHKLYCLEEFKCCKMGAYNGNSWVERPDLVIKVKDTSRQLKQCSMNAMDYSADSKTYKCNAISNRSNMLAINALKFNIEDKSPLNVAKPDPVPGFRPVICSAHSNPYKCTKSLKASVSTSSTFTIGSGFSTAVKVGGSVTIGAPELGIEASFAGEVTKKEYFNVEASKTKTHTTTDQTDVSIQVPKNTEITINLLRTVQDLEYKWKAIFELLGKYSMDWANGQKIFQDVTTVLSGSKRKLYAFGSWSYPDTDVLRVVITDKYGNMKSEGCEHETGKGKICDM